MHAGYVEAGASRVIGVGQNLIQERAPRAPLLVHQRQATKHHLGTRIHQLDGCVGHGQQARVLARAAGPELRQVGLVLHFPVMDLALVTSDGCSDLGPPFVQVFGRIVGRIPAGVAGCGCAPGRGVAKEPQHVQVVAARGVQQCVIAIPGVLAARGLDLLPLQTHAHPAHVRLAGQLERGSRLSSKLVCAEADTVWVGSANELPSCGWQRCRTWYCSGRGRFRAGQSCAGLDEDRGGRACDAELE